MEVQRILWEIAKSAVGAGWIFLGTTAPGYWLVPIVGAVYGLMRSKGQSSMKMLMRSFVDAVASVAIVFSIIFVIQFWIAFKHFLNPKMNAVPPSLVFSPPVLGVPTPDHAAVDNQELLRQKTNNLAKELFDFADQREGNRMDLENKMIAASLAQLTIPGSRDEDNLKSKLQAWNQGTRNAFMTVYLPRLQQDMNDLANAGVDTSSVTRAIATAGPREIGLRLSVLANRVGKHPPYQREITSLEADAVAREGGLKHVEVYALKSDPNSVKVASELRDGFMRRGRSVDKDIHPLDVMTPMPSGIHATYAAGDIASMDGLVRMLVAGEIVAQSDVAPSDQRQDYLTVRLKVWPCDSRCSEDFVLQRRGLN